MESADFAKNLARQDKLGALPYVRVRARAHTRPQVHSWTNNATPTEIIARDAASQLKIARGIGNSRKVRDVRAI